MLKLEALPQILTRSGQSVDQMLIAGSPEHYLPLQTPDRKEAGGQCDILSEPHHFSCRTLTT